MITKKTVLTAVSLLIFAASSSSAFAWGGERGSKNGGGYSSFRGGEKGLGGYGYGKGSCEKEPSSSSQPSTKDHTRFRGSDTRDGDQNYDEGTMQTSMQAAGQVSGVSSNASKGTSIGNISEGRPGPGHQSNTLSQEMGHDGGK
jgi:hypothetical protein